MDTLGRQVQQKIDAARALLAAIERLLTLRMGTGVAPAKAKSAPKKKSGSEDEDAGEDEEEPARTLAASVKDLQTRLAAEEIRYSLSLGYLLLKPIEDERLSARDELSRTLVAGDFAGTVDRIVRDTEKVVDAIGLKRKVLAERKNGPVNKKGGDAPKRGEEKGKKLSEDIAKSAGIKYQMSCSEVQSLLNAYPRAGDAVAAPERPRLDYKQCADCGVEMVADAETSEMKCHGCGSLLSLEGVGFEEAQIYNQEGQKSKSGRFNPNRHFLLWWTHVYACEPEEELGDPDDAENVYGEKLLTKMKEIVRREKKILRFINVEDVRSMLRECKRTSLYRNTALIMKKLTGIGPPMPSDALAQKVEKYFTKAIEISEEIRPPDRSNRNYYPFYIYKLLDAILAPEDHEQRRVLYYIYLQSEETLTRDDREWRDICDDPGMKDIKYVPTKRSAAARYRPT